MTQKQKIHKQNITRDSQECLTCFRNKDCKFKSSIALFEKNINIELDCWLRVFDKKYVTGFHMPINHVITDENGIQKSFVKWQHIINDKYSVIVEEKMYN